MIECRRCLLHDGISGVVIKEDRECNYCKLHDSWEKEFDPVSGRFWLQKLFAEMKEKRQGDYDCIIGISGGCDSSWVLAYLVDNGVEPLAVHWDNNWNKQIANENIRKIVQGLGVDLYRVGIPREQYDDLCKAFLYASTPDADIPNDIALTTVLYDACEKFDCKYLINAHSFRTEGTTPLGWTYMDGGYIEDVWNRFGSVPIPKFPNLTYERFKHYIELDIKRIRPLWRMNYDKAWAIKKLEDRFGWKWYGAHHHENLYTVFVGSYLWKKKFNMDLRFVEYSALIRSGFLLKETARKIINENSKIDAFVPAIVRKRLGFSRREFKEILELPVKSHRDYKTYHERFREDKGYFLNALMKGLIPETFYRKYVLGVN